MTKVLLRAPVFGYLLQLEWKPQDLWIGAYWVNTKDRIDIWVCLVPCFPIHYASPIDNDKEKS